MSEKKATFPCGNLTLEGVWHMPEGAGPFPAVILCHPYPLSGGDMDNSVVVTVCQTLAEAGIVGFRFNFRGVGKSGGRYGEGLGEQEDARAAISFVAATPEIDAGKLGLGGYSFGGGVAAGVALDDNRARFLVFISAALSERVWKKLQEDPRPKLFLMGSRDTYVPASQKVKQVEKPTSHNHVEIIAGADHFWWGYEAKVAQTVVEFINGCLKPGTQARLALP